VYVARARLLPTRVYCPKHGRLKRRKKRKDTDGEKKKKWNVQVSRMSTYEYHCLLSTVPADVGQDAARKGDMASEQARNSFGLGCWYCFGHSHCSTFDVLERHKKEMLESCWVGRLLPRYRQSSSRLSRPTRGWLGWHRFRPVCLWLVCEGACGSTTPGC
jgi:hypothetical protein